MKVEIIAELGVNANGRLDTAKALIDAAMEAGADTVKFQATYPRIEMSYRLMPDRVEMTEKFILTHYDLALLVDYCYKNNIRWLCTPSESDSLNWMLSKTPDRIKVGSDNLTNLPFLEEVARCYLPVILSTGMSTMEEVLIAHDLLCVHMHPREIALMHCTSAYPCPIDEANLKALTTMRSLVRCDVGWSDHTISPALACVAVALGATMIEKHITLGYNEEGPDHKASLDPLQFAMMVKLIRETEAALGDGEKKLQPSEMQNIGMIRKSVVAKQYIAAGAIFSDSNIAIMRPGFGRAPREYHKLIGKPATRSYQEGELI